MEKQILIPGPQKGVKGVGQTLLGHRLFEKTTGAVELI